MDLNQTESDVEALNVPSASKFESTLMKYFQTMMMKVLKVGAYQTTDLLPTT